jgi:hypothetical protein
LARLLREKAIDVVSRHHQALASVAGPWRVAARDREGLIEAIERADHPFALGVQWHPELSREGAPDDRLFQGFVARRRWRRRRRCSERALEDRARRHGGRVRRAHRRGALGRSARSAARTLDVAVISDTNVSKLYRSALGPLSDAPWLDLAPGEDSKSFTALERVLDFLAASRSIASRRSSRSAAASWATSAASRRRCTCAAFPTCSSDDAPGAGRFVGRRQDGREPLGRQEPRGCVPSAVARAGRHQHARDAVRRRIPLGPRAR